MAENPWEMFNREMAEILSKEVGAEIRFRPGKPGFCHRHLEMFYRSHGAETVAIMFGVVQAIIASRAWRRSALMPVSGETLEQQIRRRADVFTDLAPWCCCVGFLRLRRIAKAVKGKGDLLVAEYIYPSGPDGPRLWEEWKALKERVGTGKR